MKVKTLIAATLLAASPAIMAHSGHDHSHWTANLIHIVAGLSVLGAGVVAYVMVKANKKAAQDK